MEKIGLVLCGGGAKGAFQIGAWKALEEHGILKNVGAISGTSVGALNAVLFALGDFEKATEIWNKIQKGDLLKLPEIFKGGLFSREGLENIFQYLPLDKLQYVDKKIYASAVATPKPIFSKPHARYFNLNPLPVADIKTLLLASSAIPIIYKSEYYNKTRERYVDGGFLNIANTPVEPLYRKGYRNIYIVALKPFFNPNMILTRNGSLNLSEEYPECNFKIIKPLHPTGGFIKGTLNFDRKYISKLIGYGYEDTNLILSNKNIIWKDTQNPFDEINTYIRDKMLSLFKNEEDLKNFINEMGFCVYNKKWHTLGGKVFYENIVEMFGWKLQQHRVDFLQAHYRILDSNNVRQAWILDPDNLVDALYDYEESHKTVRN